MMSAAERIVEATMEHTLRPKSGDREKVIASVLRFVIKEYGGVEENKYGEFVVNTSYLWNLIEELENK